MTHYDKNLRYLLPALICRDYPYLSDELIEQALRKVGE